jgi:hypothetical protein
MCLRFKYSTHQRVCVLNFLRKRQIRCTLRTVNVASYTYLGLFSVHYVDCMNVECGVLVSLPSIEKNQYLAADNTTCVISNNNNA